MQDAGYMMPDTGYWMLDKRSCATDLIPQSGTSHLILKGSVQPANGNTGSIPPRRDRPR
jgi:hypothetical protein